MAQAISVDARMRQVLAEMEVISEAGGIQLGDVIHGGSPDRSPKGPRLGMAEEHRLAYRHANGPISREAVLEAAEIALTNARYAPKRDLVANTLEWRIAIARDLRPARVVAQVFGVSRQHVYRMRAQIKS